MTRKRGKAYVGASGWTYSDWRGRFYPEQVPRRQWLDYYASQFVSAGINGVLLPNAKPGGGQGMARANTRRIPVLLEGFQVHYALEATGSDGSEFAGAHGNPACRLTP